MESIVTVANLFIPPSLAELAKKKGFDEVCLAFYDLTKGDARLNWALKNQFHRNSEWSSVSAPLYQQIFLFLIQRGYYIQTELVTPEKSWASSIYDTMGNFHPSPLDSQTFTSIEDSWNEAIKSVLTILR